MQPTASILVILMLAFAVHPQRPSAANVTIIVEPETVFIERASGRHLLSFDFRLQNHGTEPVRISRIELSVFDRSGDLQIRKFLTAAGLQHGKYEIASVDKQNSAYIFNPFVDFPQELELASLRYDFTFKSGDEGAESTASVTVRPQPFTAKTKLVLPLKGRILLHDGHDFFAHHRRFDLSHPFLKEIGVTRNFTRFASDLCIVNEKGDLRRNVSNSNEDWYGFGAAVYSPGQGRIVQMRDGVPDNINGKATFTLDEFRKDPTVPAGNFVIIDHLNGEYSLIAHMKQGSVRVRLGDTVRAGQQVGQMGVSGDAYLPHVHYELRDSDELNANGLPAYFHNFVRVRGKRRSSVTVDSVNSGDILESR